MDARRKTRRGLEQVSVAFALATGAASAGCSAPSTAAAPAAPDGSTPIGSDAAAEVASPGMPHDAPAEAATGSTPDMDASMTAPTFDVTTVEAAPPEAAAPDVSTVDEAGTDGSDGGRDLSSDRTKFFGASRCAQAHVQLCEDFESGSIDKTTWTVAGTPPVVDGLQHARGAKALHITQVGNGLSTIRETKTFPEASDTYYGRIFVYFQSLPVAAMGYAHWTFVAAAGTGVPGEIRLSGQLQNGANHFGVGTDNRTDGGSGDWTNSDNDPHPPLPVPLGQWLCIEWLHQGQANETRFYWDGVEHPSLYTSATKHGGNTNPYLLPNFTNVWIGWQEYQATTATFELWVDEIAIDSQRIGCVL